MTIAIAFLVIAFIPDYPGTTKRWWMDHEYQLIAVSDTLPENNSRDEQTDSSAMDARNGVSTMKMPDSLTMTLVPCSGASSKPSLTLNYTCSSFFKWLF